MGEQLIDGRYVRYDVEKQTGDDRKDEDADVITNCFLPNSHQNQPSKQQSNDEPGIGAVNQKVELDGLQKQQYKHHDEIDDDEPVDLSLAKYRHAQWKQQHGDDELDAAVVEKRNTRKSYHQINQRVIGYFGQVYHFLRPVID